MVGRVGGGGGQGGLRARAFGVKNVPKQMLRCMLTLEIRPVQKDILLYIGKVNFYLGFKYHSAGLPCWATI